MHHSPCLLIIAAEKGRVYPHLQMRRRECIVKLLMKVDCYQEFYEEYSQSIGEDILKRQLFEPNWQAKEEMLLLCLIEKHGLGNWEQIVIEMKKHGCLRSTEEIERHYFQIYIDPFFLIHHEPAQTKTSQKPEHKYIPFDVFLNRNLDFSKLGTRDQYFQTIYNPKRHQFIDEQTAGAQGLLVDLQFHDDDSPFQRAIKFDLIEEYNRRLQKRQKLKDFIIDHRLFQYVHNKNMDLISTKYERHARKCFHAFRRVMSGNEYEKFVRKIGLNDQIHVIIAGLHHIMKSGISIKNIKRIKHQNLFMSKLQKKAHYDVPTMKRLELLLQQYGMTSQGFKVMKRAVREGDYKQQRMEIQGISIGKE